MSILDKTIELKLKLEEHQIKLRKDSALCSKYINGTIDLTLDQVVRRMCEMKYLYEYCHMKEIKYNVYKMYLHDKKKSDKNIKYVKDGSLSKKAEQIALETWSNGKYPEKFPWEKESYNIVKFLSNTQKFINLYLFIVIIMPTLYLFIKNIFIL